MPRRSSRTWLRRTRSSHPSHPGFAPDQRRGGVFDHGPDAPSRTDRADWLLELRRENERQEDALETLDAYWTETDDAHRSSVDRFLSMLPVRGSVLDAACGIGRYVGTVLASDRSVTAVDASARHLEA